MVRGPDLTPRKNRGRKVRAEHNYCRKCNELLVAEINWYKSAHTKGDYICIPCVAINTTESSARWRKKVGPDKMRKLRKNAQLKRQYNISLDDYDSLFLSQNQSCVICAGS